jgi:hypothetical protein
VKVRSVRLFSPIFFPLLALHLSLAERWHQTPRLFKSPLKLEDERRHGALSSSATRKQSPTMRRSSSKPSLSSSLVHFTLQKRQYRRSRRSYTRILFRSFTHSSSSSGCRSCFHACWRGKAFELFVEEVRGGKGIKCCSEERYGKWVWKRRDEKSSR